MENIKEKLKNFKFNENDLIKSFFIILFVLIFCLIYINQFSIQYFINGFNSTFSSSLKVYFLDVGQASSTLIVLPNKATLLIDTGSGESENSFIKNLDLLLHKNGIKAIDYLILTHSDEDHVGGAVAVLKKYQVYNVFRPKLMSTSENEVENPLNYSTVMTDIYANVITSIYQEPNCNVEFIEDTYIMAGKDTNLRFWTCHETYYKDTNSYSPFISLNFLEYTFLFTGDATEAREKEFLQDFRDEGENLEVYFLSVAHHGSKYSTTDLFLEAINPTFAFVSAGDDEHPSGNVLERLNSHGVKDIFVTKEVGTIGIGIKENGQYYIKTLSNFVDLPFIVVIVCFLIFAVVNLQPYDLWKRHKNRKFVFKY